MVQIRHGLVITSIALVLAMQGCTFAPKPPDPDLQQAALERWNRCIQRFETQSDHYCDGHRRDVLATFPLHLADQVNAMLSQKTHAKRASTLMKTGLGTTSAAEESKTMELLGINASEAKTDDL